MHFLRPVLFWYLQKNAARSAAASTRRVSRGHARSSDVELADSVRDVHARLLDVVLDAVEQRALVDDERAQVLEQLRQVRDRLGDLAQLAVALPQVRGDVLRHQCRGLALVLCEVRVMMSTRCEGTGDN